MSSPPGDEAVPTGTVEGEHPHSSNPGQDTNDLHAGLAASMSTLTTKDDDDLAKAIELSKAEASLHSESVEAENARREAQHQKDLDLALEASKMDAEAMKNSLEAEEKRQEEELRKVIRESMLTSRYGGGSWGGLPKAGESSSIGERVEGVVADTLGGGVAAGANEIGDDHAGEHKEDDALGHDAAHPHHEDGDKHDDADDDEHAEPKEDGKGGITV